MKVRAFVVTFAVAMVLGALASVANAADNVACSVDFVTVISDGGGQTTTALPTTGSCNWTKGSSLLMQCTNDVYVDTDKVVPVIPVLLADGGEGTWDGGTRGGVATNADLRIDFTLNLDPYPIYLGNEDLHVSLLGVGDAGTCKFAKTVRSRNAGRGR